MRRPCYQCDEDLEALTDARNEVIRAWGREQLRVADEVLLANVQDAVWDDWKELDEEQDESVPEVVEVVKPTSIRASKVPKPT